jgi:hypothetical protein
MTLRSRILAITACASIIVLAGCGGAGSKSGKPATDPGTPNRYTNLSGGNGPILAIKIDDTAPAHPQLNLDKADVIYIEQVEGGLTRIASIFSNPKTLPDEVGPVRSARISDLDILAQYGHVGFSFSGAQTLFYPKIREANLENISADREPASIYSRDPLRSAPTDLIVHPKLLLTKTIDVEKRSIDLPKDPGWTFGSAPVGGKAVSSVAIKWPASRYSATWSAVEKRWLMNYDGKPDLAANGLQLGSPTLIIQKVVITPSIYHDREGGVTPFSQTVGSGTAYLMRDGRAIPIFWNRSSPEVATSWTLKDGTPAHFATGQIWIALTDTDPSFTYPVAAASPSSKK